jgi:hypothetical protein
MLKHVTAFFAILLMGWILVGSATSASAQSQPEGCCDGPIAPTYVYNTVPKIKHVVRYHDVVRTNYVYRIHPIVHVTQVQPIVYVHNITRVHHYTVGIVRDVDEEVTQWLPVQSIVTSQVINTYSCGCSLPGW